jgi:hypothetical protein
MYVSLSSASSIRFVGGDFLVNQILYSIENWNAKHLWVFFSEVRINVEEKGGASYIQK